MWIRSQSRESLLNVKDLCIYESNYEEKTYQFRCFGFGDDYYILGNYSSKEKAMKVLDMIQEEIQHGTIVKKTEKFDVCRETVFEMPQDDEV